MERFEGMESLAARWRKTWLAAGGMDEGTAIFNHLVDQYNEPHRAYHNLEHIRECLEHLDPTRHLMARPAEVELAVWFHDAIYDTQRHDNEERSALLAEETLRAAGTEPELAQRVGDLIRLTTHAHVLPVGDGALLCDIDLAILGAPPERFARYDAAIRREYEWVPEDVYRQERGRVLAGFLDRARIYTTPFFYQRLERQARDNLNALLNQQPS